MDNNQINDALHVNPLGTFVSTQSQVNQLMAGGGTFSTVLPGSDSIPEKTNKGCIQVDFCPDPGAPGGAGLVGPPGPPGPPATKSRWSGTRWTSRSTGVHRVLVGVQRVFPDQQVHQVL